MAAVALLGGMLAPGLIFDALSRMMVNNVILIGRLEEEQICLLMSPISSPAFQGKFIFAQLSSSLLLLAPLPEN